MVVVLKVTEVEPKNGQIVVEDRLPAGFDIENPALLKGTDLKAFSWLPSTYTPVFSAFRDDRFVAAYLADRCGRKVPAQMTMAYVMRAVNPGRLHPCRRPRGGHVPARPLRADIGREGGDRRGAVT